MFQAIRKHLNPTTVVAFVALVFAMTGGAFAASGGSGGGGTGSKTIASVTRGAGGNPISTTAKSKAKPKTKAGPRGPAGPAGKNGANGATGPAGAQGAQGVQGPAGAAGAKGETGPAGTNGTNGTNGTTGFTSKLPKGETETGDWSIQATVPGTGAGEGSASTTVSFAIPLATAPETIYVKAPTKEEVERHEFPAAPEGCTGNVEEPGATEGHLCVFAAFEANVSELGICPAAVKGKAFVSCLVEIPLRGKADATGAMIAVEDESPGSIALNGSWAVTAE